MIHINKIYLIRRINDPVLILRFIGKPHSQLFI